MKKIILVATCVASVSAYALPTYEPFTEYAPQIAANGQTFVTLSNGVPLTPATKAPGSVSNAFDLGTNGLIAPSGETWTAMYYCSSNEALLSTSPIGTNIVHGLDVYVVSNASIFTYVNVSNLIPAIFPGCPASGQAITNIVENPGQSLINTTGSTYAEEGYIVGNSPVLTFAQPIARPTTGTKTLFISYLFVDAQLGQTGTGNDGRYLAFLASSNLVEGAGTSGYYTNWQLFFNVFTNSVKPPGTATIFPAYFGHGILESNSGSVYLGTCDTSQGKFFSSSPFLETFGTPEFIVGEVIITPGGTINDTNIMWVNPATNGFGGTTPPASPIFQSLITNMAGDVGGMVLIDRVGNGASGGVGTNYIANLMLGTTWSYVTGGPEFTVQPTNVVNSPGTTITLSATAVAAGQSVGYQWQINGVNVNNGPNGTGGTATVSGATNSSLTLAGIGSGDAGTYQAVATASSTGYVLDSSNVTLTIVDPGFLTQPQNTTANYGGVVTLSAQVQTTTGSMSYAWYDGANEIPIGATGNGSSTASGSQGTTSGGIHTITLTLSNVSYLDIGTYTLVATNASNLSTSSSGATLYVNDPYIAVQPPAAVEVASGGAANIPVTAYGTGITYQWNGYPGTGDYSQTTTSNLTLTGAQASDAGTVNVTVSGSSGQPALTSSNAIVYFDTVPSALTQTPAKLVQQVGTHLALVASVSGGSGLFHMNYQLNGTNLNAGTQPDGSSISGPGTILTGPGGTSALVLNNLQLLDSGTYTVIASNAAGTVSASSVVQVVPLGQLTLSSNNLIVIRVGDGAEPLSASTGNTLYLDQFTTSGIYSNTIMVPDSGSNAIVVAGANFNAAITEGSVEGYLTLSSNQQYLNFGGFCYSYPFTGNADVTIGQQETGGSTSDVRGIYALNASGVMALVYTNYGLYSGGHGFRSVYSTDGLTNFWTTGSASAGTVKYVNAGPAGASYTITTPGSGIPALSAANNGGVVLGLYGANLIFSDSLSAGSDATMWLGLDELQGTPIVANTNTTQILPGGVYHGADFAISPDQNTLYLADDDVSAPTGNGGVQRWDNVSGTWTYAYNIVDTTGSGTNGLRGLTVYFPPQAYGQNILGATLYATTSEGQGNRIIQIVDNGSGSTSTLLVTAGPNQFYHGIRFGPISVPLAITTPPASQAAEVGQQVDFLAGVGGVFAYYFPNATGTSYNLITVPPTTFQWYTNGVAIPGATNFEFSITNVQMSNAGSYTFVASNSIATASNSPAAVLTVNPFSSGADLVGWWRFLDGSGTTAVDSSTYGDNGTLNNFPGDNSEWVTGISGTGALNFADADAAGSNVVVVPDAPQLNFSNGPAFTLAAWIRVASNTPTSAALIAKGFGNGGEQYCFDVYTGYLRIFVRNAVSNVSVINATSVIPPTNKWMHVAATVDVNEELMALYTNGQLYGTSSAPSSMLYTTNVLTIGNRTSSSTNGYDLPFIGEMQDVRIYNTSLGASDISNLYATLAPSLAVENSPSQIIKNPAAIFTSNGHFQLTLSGVPNSTYHLWTTTNVALKPVISTWTMVTSGMFDGSGTAIYTDPSATPVAKYYTITQP